MGASCCKNNSSIIPRIQNRYQLDQDNRELVEIENIEQERKKENEEFEKYILNREQNEKKMKDLEQNNDSDKCYCYSCKNFSNQANTNTTIYSRSYRNSNNIRGGSTLNTSHFCTICQVICCNSVIECGINYCVGCDLSLCPC